jgi:hypothetical protein
LFDLTAVAVPVLQRLYVGIVLIVSPLTEPQVPFMGVTGFVGTGFGVGVGVGDGVVVLVDSQR